LRSPPLHRLGALADEIGHFPLRKESDVHSYSLSEFRLLNLSRCVRACRGCFGILKLT
jgi:hypothetical protein